MRELGARALKCYTCNGNWWLDDETVAYPMLEEAQRLGLAPDQRAQGLARRSSRPGPRSTCGAATSPRRSRDWPRLRFVAYHSGYFPGARHRASSSRSCEALPRSARKRVYAELGSAFAVAFLESPEAAAHLVGSLLKALGSRNIVWGTDSIWWGSPQWQIDAFKALTIPERCSSSSATRRSPRSARRASSG